MAYILELFVVLSIEDSSSGPCLFGKPPRKTDSPETFPEGLCGFRYKLHPFKIFSHLVKSVGLTPMGFPSVGFPSGKPPRKTHLVKSVGLTPLRFYLVTLFLLFWNCAGRGVLPPSLTIIRCGPEPHFEGIQSKIPTILQRRCYR